LIFCNGKARERQSGISQSGPERRSGRNYNNCTRQRAIQYANGQAISATIKERIRIRNKAVSGEEEARTEVQAEEEVETGAQALERSGASHARHEEDLIVCSIAGTHSPKYVQKGSMRTRYLSTL
jgi:hypothetical protein